MGNLRVLLQRCLGMFRREGLERDLDEELRFHLEADIEEGLRRGMSRAEARGAALRHLGGVAGTKEAYRETAGWPALDAFLQDLRYCLRTLRKSPGFTLAAAASLALGIGANTALFSLLNAVVLRTLPVKDPGQLVQLVYTIPKTGPDNWNGYWGYAQLERFRKESRTMSGIFGTNWSGRLNVTYRGSSGLAEGMWAAGNLFPVLGVKPQVGRLLTPDDDRSDGSAVVLSDRMWRNRYGADPSVIGSLITVNQLPFTVVGVTPPEFTGISIGAGPDLYLPLHGLDRLKPDPKRWTTPFTSWLTIAGRMRPGVTAAQAQAELDVIYRQFSVEELEASERRDSASMQRFVRVSHLEARNAARGTTSGIRRAYETPLKLLLAVAGMVLLAACANLANLLLARASGRGREIAVRLSLGAGRGRIVRQLLTESVVLAGMGGVLALVLARWGSVVLVRMISTGEAPTPLDTHPDWLVFGFAAGISLLTGLLFGLAPAIRGTQIDPAAALKDGGRASGHASRRLEGMLVVAQVALSLVLVTGAGVFTRTLDKLWSVDVGYNRDNVLMFSVDAGAAGYPATRAAAVYRAILERVRSLPDVRNGAASIVRPVDDAFSLIDQVNEVDGRRLADSEVVNVAWNAISGGYFATVGTPILLGRDFDERDDENAPQVVMVNEALAARVFPGQSPLGHRLGDATVVGVVRNALYEGARDKPKPVLYRQQFQHGKSQEYRWGFVSFEMRYGSGEHLLDQARREVAAVDRNLAVFRVKTLQQQTEQSLLRERLLATLSGFFGALSLLLACVGLYGLMAYTVARRTAEIGIRLALGAQARQVTWLVLRETMWLTIGGIACGVPLALWAAQQAKSLVFGISPGDPVMIAGAALLLGCAGAAAALIPVRRALRVDPMSALRVE